MIRTFAKSYALAGLRVGYAVGRADLIADLSAVFEYPVDRLALAGATAALADVGHHRRIVEMVIGERERVRSALRGAGWEVVESHANFVLGRPPGGDARGIAAELRDQQILVRHFPDPELDDRLRITVGTPEQNDALLAALAIEG